MQDLQMYRSQKGYESWAEDASPRVYLLCEEWLYFLEAARLAAFLQYGLKLLLQVSAGPFF